MVKRVIKKELKLENCGFEHDPVESVVRSQWQSTSHSMVYLIYRWLVAIFNVAVVIIALEGHLRRSGFGTFLIYLTRWGITINMIVGVYGAILVTIWHFHTEHHENILKNEKMPISFKFYWALHNIALITSFVITIVYWAALHRFMKSNDLSNILQHAMNAVIMFVDILIVDHPMRLYHVVQPLCFGAIYASFSFIYYLCGGVNDFGNHYIYHILDWAKPGMALAMVAMVAVLICAVHMALFWVYKLRVFTQRKLFTTEFILPTVTTKSTEGTQ